jgi:hypothetical protein
MKDGAGRLKSLVSQHHYLSVLLFILLAKVLFWSWSLAVSHWFPLSPLTYFSGGHHYQIDPRIAEHRIDFFTLWIYCDADWYLSIAERGYPNTDEMKKAAAAHEAGTGSPYTFTPGDPVARYQRYTEWDNDAKYAFFPLYPLSIALFRLILPLHVAAFVATNAISALAFLMLYALTFAYFSDKSLAFRSLVLLVFYPFSAFYQAYYSEGLFLLLAVLSFYCLKKGRPGLSVLCGSILALTRPTGVAIVVPLLVLAVKQGLPGETRAAKRAQKLRRKTAVRMGAIDWSRSRLVCLTPLGLVPYLLINYFNTGHWDYFVLAQRRWGFEGSAFLGNFLNNTLVAGSQFFSLKFLSDHNCQVDYTMMLISLFIVVLSYKRLPLELWAFSAVQWLVPLLLKDLMSFSRYVSISFPLFIYLAGIKRRFVFWVLFGCFLAGSLVIDGRIVTWHWVG